MLKLLCIIVFLSLYVTGLSQGKIDGFYKSAYEGSVVLGGGFEDSKKYFAGRTKLDLERSTYYAALFSSYGITNRLNINVSLPYITSNNQSDFQDISLFLKYKAKQFKLNTGILELSLAGGFSTPVSDYTIGGLNDIGQRATVFDARTLLHFMTDTSWFVTVQSGFSYKLDEVPNSVPATLKFGRATSYWYCDFYYDYQYSFGGIDYRGTPAPQNFKEFGVDFHKIGGTFHKPFSSSLGAYITTSYIFWGRNTFVGASYGLGISYSY